MCVDECVAPPHLSSWHVFGFTVELVYVCAERLEVWDDKLLPEGLSEQHDVALHAPEAQDTV